MRTFARGGVLLALSLPGALFSQPLASAVPPHAPLVGMPLGGAGGHGL